MIRHGLVHKSPGYMCPFCPEREHKYPRPDNLQRYAHPLSDSAAMTDKSVADTFACTTRIKTRTIFSSERFWNSGLMGRARHGGAERIPQVVSLRRLACV